MTENKTLLALVEKLGQVDWPGRNSLHWAPKSKTWFRRHHWVSGGQDCYRETKIDEYIAECLAIAEAYRQLREKWESVDTERNKDGVRVTLFNSDSYETYTGQTELDAVLAAVRKEL